MINTNDYEVFRLKTKQENPVWANYYDLISLLYNSSVAATRRRNKHGGQLCVVPCAGLGFSGQPHENTPSVHILFRKYTGLCVKKYGVRAVKLLNMSRLCMM